MKIEGILKFCFWISLHQGMISFLSSRIQGYMLSLMNEVDLYVASTVGFVWDAKPVFPTGDASSQNWERDKGFLRSITIH